MKSKKSIEPERRILSLKTDLVLIILFVFSIALYWFFFHIDIQNHPTLKEISRLLADSFLVSSIIGFIFEKILRRETEEKIATNIDLAIDKLEDDFPEILINCILYNKSFQKELLSGEKINEIFTSCLVLLCHIRNIYINILKLLVISSNLCFCITHVYCKEKKGCEAEDKQPSITIKQVKEMLIMKTAPSGA